MGNKAGGQGQPPSPTELETGLTSEERTVIWRIKNFTRLQELESCRNGKTSIYFEAGKEVNRAGLWKLRLRFHDQQRIGLWLTLKKCSRPWGIIYAKIRISILDSNNISNEIGDWGRYGYTMGLDWGLWDHCVQDNFVTLDQLKKAGVIVNDVLTVQINAVVYGKQKMDIETPAPGLLTFETGAKDVLEKTDVWEVKAKEWEVKEKQLEDRVKELEVKAPNHPMEAGACGADKKISPQVLASGGQNIYPSLNHESFSSMSSPPPNSNSCRIEDIPQRRNVWESGPGICSRGFGDIKRRDQESGSHGLHRGLLQTMDFSQWHQNQSAQPPQIHTRPGQFCLQPRRKFPI